MSLLSIASAAMRVSDVENIDEMSEMLELSVETLFSKPAPDELSAVIMFENGTAECECMMVHLSVL